MSGALTIGPLLYHWPADEIRDFYFRIADEAPVETVYLGEVICAKRMPFIEKDHDAIRDRLEAGGKTVVFTTLSEVAVQTDRNAVKRICDRGDADIEVNDASSLWLIDGRRFRAGQLLNCYNTGGLEFMVRKGAHHVCLPVELRAAGIGEMAAAGKALGTGVEVQVFGRVSLALSARCYHARAHGRTKDNCKFICERDPDGLDLQTVDTRQFLAINGIQTLSHSYLNLAREVPALQEMGVTHFRLSPHTTDMVAVARIFDALLGGQIDTVAADAKLDELGIEAPFSNGFFHSKPGHLRVTAVV